jgi:hypothetical protein
MGIKHTILKEYNNRGFIATDIAYKNIILVLADNATVEDLFKIAESLGVTPRVIPSTSFSGFFEVSWMETLEHTKHNTSILVP